MGSSISKNLCKDKNNSDSHPCKENRNLKPTFLNPENLVLPTIMNGPTRLRSTDNGNILQSGGTISGRKNNPSNNPEEFSELYRFIQKKPQAYRSSQENVSFQTLFGHKKSHSDPDIVRKMMEENETEDDDDGKFETESNPNQRSRAALSPSKAKIKSRKKKKAPEPPQSNTLPRSITTRNLSKYESEEISKLNYTYESTETPRRPLPPIPLDELPPQPPPPPPDYNRTMNNRELLKASNKNFQKNRKIVDKWKFSKPAEIFAEKRQRSKSLDRFEDVRLREEEHSSNAEIFDRKYSLRNLSHLENSDSPQRENVNENSKNVAFLGEIVDAAKQRAERIARNRNLSFRSSMNQPYEAEMDDTGQIINGSEDYFFNERSPHRKRHGQSDTRGYRGTQNHKEQELGIKNNHEMNSNRNLQLHANKQKYPFQNEIPELNTRSRQNPQKCLIEQRISRSSENLDGFNNEKKHIVERESSNSSAKYQKDQYPYKQCYPSNHSITHSNKHGDILLKEHRNQPFTNLDSYHQKPRDLPSMIQYKNEHKRTTEYNGDSNKNETDANLKSHLTKNVDVHQQPAFINSSDVMKQQNYSHYKPESEYPINSNDNNVSGSFSRVNAIRRRSRENNRKNSPDYKSKDSENFIVTPQGKNLDLGILPLLPYDKQPKRSARPQETIIPFLSNCTVSSSSISEEEMEINLQLRPTLPRRPIEIPRFSPTDVWKSINLDFFKSHQQRSDVSSENGDDTIEEKIHHINRRVAPRRLIHDRSADSGISPDAGSPLLLNENLDSPIITNNALCSANEISDDVMNNTWIPEHDLEDSDCASNNSKEHKINTSNEIVQPKLALPNFMFPSRSLPRSDTRNEIQEKDTSDKEKTRNRDKRKKGTKNSESQHFNSLRNLKLFGAKPKLSAVDVNGLDSNWFLSRSLPNFENVNNIDDAKIESEVPDVSALDNVRRSNSESRAIQQENIKSYSLLHSNYKNCEWRKSFPGQSSEGHVMYLPEYCSTTVMCQKISENQDLSYTQEAKANIESEHSERKLDSDSSDKKPKNKKKFSYQSTIRQLEKKKIEEQLAKEVQEKEKKRETEIEWMNIVEDEFRKQRIREKTDVKQKLRIYNLEVNKEAKFSGDVDLQNSKHDSNSEIPAEKNSTQGFHGDVQCSSAIVYERNRADVSKNAQNISVNENSQKSRDIFHTSDPIPCLNEVSDQRTTSYLHGIDSIHQQTHTQKNFYREISAINKNVQESNYQKNEEKSKPIKEQFQNSNVSQHISKTNYSKKMSSNGRLESKEKEVSVERNFIHEKDSDKTNGTYGIEGNRVGNVASYFGQNKIQKNREMNDLSTESVERNAKNKLSNYGSSNNVINSHDLSDKPKELSRRRFLDTKDDRNFEKTETIYSERICQNYIPSIEENNDRKTITKSNGDSYSIQQPTGMKKWLRRQNRENQRHEHIPRPEPEGGRSSSDDCKQIDGKKEIMNGRSRPVGGNFPNHTKCNHGRSLHCSICNDYRAETNGLSRNGIDARGPSLDRSDQAEKARNDKYEVIPKMRLNGNLPSHSDVPEFVRDSMEEYELHTKLCRTNSGRTFESHSYYVLERRRDDPTEYESSRKPTGIKQPQSNFFSSANFEKELKENVRKKSRDAEKRTPRKYQCHDFDSDESGSDAKESRYQRPNARNGKKRSVSEHREPSFSRNHPHRNGARIKSPANGHFINGRSPSAPRSSHPHAV